MSPHRRWIAPSRARAGLFALALSLVFALAAGAQSAVPVGQELQANGYTTGDQVLPAVALLDDGDFVVVWATEDSTYGPDFSGTSVEGLCYDSDAQRIGFEFQVNVYVTGDQIFPSVEAQSGGGFLVVWQSAGSATDPSASTIVGRRYDAACLPIGGEFQVNDYTTDSQITPDVAVASDDTFVVVWESYGSPGDDVSGASIQGRRFAADGTPIGGQMQVNTLTDLYQTLPNIAAGPTDDFVVVWASYGDDGGGYDANSIRARPLGADGVPTGTDFQVNTTAMGLPIESYWYPSVDTADSGEFLVVWTSEGSPGDDTSYLSVQARAFDGLAVPLGDQVQVNELTPNNQRLARVAASGDRFLVVWESDGSTGFDTSDLSVQARRIDLLGALDGGELQLNGYTTGGQAAPVVSRDQGGDFLVAWESFGSPGNDASGISLQVLPFGLDSDGDGVADSVDCAPADPGSALVDACGTCGGDGSPCTVFTDDFESGDTTAWSSTMP